MKAQFLKLCLTAALAVTVFNTGARAQGVSSEFVAS